MTKQQFSLQIDDVSAFARSLVVALERRHATKPLPVGQVEMLNLIARTQGRRNWQDLRLTLPPAQAHVASTPAAPSPSAEAAPAEEDEGQASSPPLTDNARKALGQFDARGRLMRWPVKFTVQKLVMWVLWTRFDAKRTYTEAEVNAILKSAHLFFDHATLRRELVNHRLMARKSDCSEYRKLPARPDDETRALLSAWRARLRRA